MDKPLDDETLTAMARYGLEMTAQARAAAERHGVSEQLAGMLLVGLGLGHFVAAGLTEEQILQVVRTALPDLFAQHRGEGAPPIVTAALRSSLRVVK